MTQHIFMLEKQDRVISAVTVQRARRPGVPISAVTRDFSLLQNVQTCCGAHTAFHSVGDEFISLGDKATVA
jgi:hypothetical protein